MVTQSKQKKAAPKLNPNKIVVTVPWQVWSFSNTLRDVLALDMHEFVGCTLNGDLWNDDRCIGRIRYGSFGEDTFKCVVFMIEDDDRGDRVGVGDILDARMKFKTEAEAKAWIGDIEHFTGPLGWTYDDKKCQLRFAILGEQMEKLYSVSWKFADARKARLAAERFQEQLHDVRHRAVFHVPE